MPRISHIRFLVFGLFLGFQFACNQVKKKSPEALNRVQSEFDKIRLESDSCWNSMMVSDNNKISNMDRLLKELGLLNGSNPSRLNQLADQTRQLEAFRYSRNGLKPDGVDLIGRYDSVTNQVWTDIRKEVQANPEAEKYQIIQQLVSEIQAADDSVLFFRMAYDRSVDRYNAYLKKNKKELKRIISNLDSMRPYPVFRLTP